MSNNPNQIGNGGPAETGWESLSATNGQNGGLEVVEHFGTGPREGSERIYDENLKEITPEKNDEKRDRYDYYAEHPEKFGQILGKDADEIKDRTDWYLSKPEAERGEILQHEIEAYYEKKEEEKNVGRATMQAAETSPVYQIPQMEGGPSEIEIEDVPTEESRTVSYEEKPGVNPWADPEYRKQMNDYARRQQEINRETIDYKKAARLQKKEAKQREEAERARIEEMNRAQEMAQASMEAMQASVEDAEKVEEYTLTDADRAEIMDIIKSRYDDDKQEGLTYLRGQAEDFLARKVDTTGMTPKELARYDALAKAQIKKIDEMIEMLNGPAAWGSRGGAGETKPEKSESSESSESSGSEDGERLGVVTDEPEETKSEDGENVLDEAAEEAWIKKHKEGGEGVPEGGASEASEGEAAPEAPEGEDGHELTLEEEAKWKKEHGAPEAPEGVGGAPVAPEVAPVAPVAPEGAGEAPVAPESGDGREPEGEPAKSEEGASERKPEEKAGGESEGESSEKKSEEAAAEKPAEKDEGAERAELKEMGRGLVPDYMLPTWNKACEVRSVEQMRAVADVLETLKAGKEEDAAKIVTEDWIEDGEMMGAVALLSPAGADLIEKVLSDYYGRPSRANRKYLKRVRSTQKLLETLPPAKGRVSEARLTADDIMRRTEESEDGAVDAEVAPEGEAEAAEEDDGKYEGLTDGDEYAKEMFGRDAEILLADAEKRGEDKKEILRQIRFASEFMNICNRGEKPSEEMLAELCKGKNQYARTLVFRLSPNAIRATRSYVEAIGGDAKSLGFLDSKIGEYEARKAKWEEGQSPRPEPEEKGPEDMTDEEWLEDGMDRYSNRVIRVDLSPEQIEAMVSLLGIPNEEEKQMEIERMTEAIEKWNALPREERVAYIRGKGEWSKETNELGIALGHSGYHLIGEVGAVSKQLDEIDAVMRNRR